MGSESEVREPRDLRKMVLVMIIAVLVVAVGAIGYVYYTSKGASGGIPRAIISGDSVTLNYIGMLPDGRVFDTSLWSVAQDNANYTKSLTFTLRSEDAYKSFTMTAGNYGPGGTIKGFALGVLGMHVGDQETIEVAPEDGYPLITDRLTTLNVTDDLPITEIMTEDQYRSLYGIEPIAQDIVTHPFWQWNVLVAQVSGGFVTTKAQPTVGASVYPYGNPGLETDSSGWEIKVVGYDPTANGGIGTVTIKNMLSPEDVYNIKGKDASGNAMILWSFDETNQTFTLNRSDSSIGYNAEVSGRTLFFEVTIVKVEPSLS